jgi:hypothetical protein
MPKTSLGLNWAMYKFHAKDGRHAAWFCLRADLASLMDGGALVKGLSAIRLNDDVSALGGRGQARHLPRETHFASALPRVGDNQRRVRCGPHRRCDLQGRGQLLL